MNSIDLDQIKSLQKNKYQTWNWNYGESPTSTNVKEERYLGGKLEIHFDLVQGKLRNVKLYGDFLDTGDISYIERLLEDEVYEISNIEGCLKSVKIDELILNISNDDLLKCIFS